MAELLDLVRTEVAPLLDDGESLRDAVALAKMGDKAAAVPAAGAKGAKAGKARKEAFKAIGLSQHMVWGVSDRQLFIFKAGILAPSKPKDLLGQHRLFDAVLGVELGVRGANIGNAAFTVKLYGIPLSLQGKEDDVLRFTETIQRIMYT